MMAKNHAASGLLVGLVGADLSPHFVAPIIIGTAVGSLFPDLDEPGSRIAHVLSPISTVFAWIMAKASGGHRHGTHSLIGVGGLALLLYAVCQLPALSITIGTRAISMTSTGLVVSVFALILWKAVIPKFLRWMMVGGWLSIVAISVLIGFVGQHMNALVLVLAFTLGNLVHIAGDALTPSGVPLAWPISGKTVTADLFTTNSALEHFVGLGLWVSVIILAFGIHTQLLSALPHVNIQSLDLYGWRL